VQLAADQIASTLVRQQLTAVTHDVALERERAANLEASEQMLQALASVLDIRQVFPQLSEITRKVLPHDRLTMAFLDGQGSCVMEAASNDEGPLAWRARGIDTSQLSDGFFKIVDDLTNYVKPGVTYVYSVGDGSPNGWTEPALQHFDPWDPSKTFGGAGNIASDLQDPAFAAAPCP